MLLVALVALLSAMVATPGGGGPPAAPPAAPVAIPVAAARAAAPIALPAPPYNDSPFYLPWPAGITYRVIQGNNSVTSDHYGEEADAWDFSMPEGSLLLAPRAGMVTMTKGDSNTGGFNFYLGYDANYLVIAHGDGTQSLFLHLMYHGVLVQPGQRVERGQPIAYSGTTGFSGGPHLHFTVEQYGTYNRVTQSVPAAFADVASWGGVPLVGRKYTSGNAPSGPAEARPLVHAERQPRSTVAQRPNPYANRLDFPVPHGHFYLQGNGHGGQGRLGFLVADDDGVPFNATLDELGGPAVAGYPISQRFTFAGRTTQVFQKLVLQAHAEDGSVVVLNTLDALHDQGFDAALQARLIPPPEPTDADAGLAWPAVVSRHQAFLDGAPALKAAYFAAADPLTRYGLPMTHPVDEGAVVVVRLQRAVLQLWKQDQPWAAAGQVTIANAGDLAKELGLFPTDALTPDPQPIP